MYLIISCLTFLTFQTVVQSLSGTAQLTWYISYAPCCPENPNYDPNADTTECVEYSACNYSGEFWAIGNKSFNYVQNTNLVAFFDLSDPNGDNFMTNYGGKEITLSKNGVTFTAIIADSCADSDCDGCCTTNSQPSGFLVDMEYWTAINNFGSTDDINGQIQFTIGAISTTPPPVNGNILITNQASTQSWWVAFFITNIDLSCGGAITNVEISDNNHYSGMWVGYDDNQYGYYSFPNNGNAFTEPISVRITKSYNAVTESIVAHDLISLTVGEIFDFGSNFCGNKSPTKSPTKYPTKSPHEWPTKRPTRGWWKKPPRPHCWIGNACDRTEDCCSDEGERDRSITCSGNSKLDSKHHKFCCVNNMGHCHIDMHCCGDKTKCIDYKCHNSGQWRAFSKALTEWGIYDENGEFALYNGNIELNIPFKYMLTGVCLIILCVVLPCYQCWKLIKSRTEHS